MTLLGSKDSSRNIHQNYTISFFYLTIINTPYMSYLLYLMFRCDSECDGKFEKFGNFVGSKHTLSQLTADQAWCASRCVRGQ